MRSDLLWALTVEDGVLESLSVIAYLIGSLALFYVAWFERREVTLIKKFMLIVYGIGMFVLAGEEWSWGERFFHFKFGESIRAANVQHEFNFHNMPIFMGEMYLHEARILSLASGLIILCPFLFSYAVSLRNIMHRLGIIIPRWSAVAVAVISYAYVRTIGPWAYEVDWFHQVSECREFTAALSFMLLAVLELTGSNVSHAREHG